jgi:hypothetical protein
VTFAGAVMLMGLSELATTVIVLVPAALATKAWFTSVTESTTVPLLGAA